MHDKELHLSFYSIIFNFMNNINNLMNYYSDLWNIFGKNIKEYNARLLVTHRPYYLTPRVSGAKL